MRHALYVTIDPDTGTVSEPFIRACPERNEVPLLVDLERCRRAASLQGRLPNGAPPVFEVGFFDTDTGQLVAVTTAGSVAEGFFCALDRMMEPDNRQARRAKRRSVN